MADISAAFEAKQELEQKIKDMIKDYEKEYGLKVYNIDYNRVSYWPDKKAIKAIRHEVEIVITL